ncbi:MAG: sugar phosphate nucleotidyltransferase [Oscillospiraceae bacterium]
MSDLTLVVLAAGMGSRFGTRIKQLEPLGPNGELLIDYSVYDAMKAGFNRVVFIIRRDIEELFKSRIGDRISAKIKTEYVFQSPDNLPCRAGDFPDRTKPWGTAQALYCCRDVLNGPFGVVNADDFYGRDAFVQLAGFLNGFTADGCSIGFMLKNTLSDFGAVNRGICKVNGEGLLYSVEETKAITRHDGIISGTFRGEEKLLEENDTVSMSMWGFDGGFMPRLETQLCKFLNSLPANEPKAELTIADAVGAEITENGYMMRNITTDSVWFGMTYEEEAEKARLRLLDSIKRGVYTSPLA